MLRTMCALAICMAMAAPVALADTPQELRVQAAQPWRETITAYGREIAIDVSADVPQDATAAGVYVVRPYEGMEQIAPEIPVQQPEAPAKRRGIAHRPKPDEVFTPERFDPDYHAFGHPLAAGEVRARADALLAPMQRELPDVEIRFARLIGCSPRYFYDKNAGTWGDTVIPGACGSYGIEYEQALGGLSIESAQAPIIDRIEPEMGVYPPGIVADYHYAGNEPYESLRVDSVQIAQTLAENVALCPLDTVKDALRGLVQGGYIREMHDLRLTYAAFAYGEIDVENPWNRPPDALGLLLPVWAADCMVAYAPEQEISAHDFAQTVMINAQTGALVERRLVKAWPEDQ